MHSAVLQNKKYIAFSRKNTVEVIALGALDRGIQNEDPRAATYPAKDSDGNEVEYLVNWPGLTVEQVNALRRSRAGSYNQTGRIPYTAIVDPHTLEQTESFLGSQSAQALIKAVTEARRQLIREHGRGMDRADLERIHDATRSSRQLLEEQKYAGALAALDEAARGKEELPQALRDKIAGAREQVIRTARKELRALQALARVDPEKARADLSRIKDNFTGTGLEEKVETLLAKVSD